MTKFWFINTDNKERINVINIDNPNFSKFREYIKCRIIETSSFTYNGFNYAIFMNDLGIYEDNVPNPVAEKLLKKVNLNWGGFPLCGNYLIGKYLNEDDGGTRYFDMDLTPRQFIDEFNRAIAEQRRHLEELFSE